MGSCREVDDMEPSLVEAQDVLRACHEREVATVWREGDGLDERAALLDRRQRQTV